MEAQQSGVLRIRATHFIAAAMLSFSFDSRSETIGGGTAQFVSIGLFFFFATTAMLLLGTKGLSGRRHDSRVLIGLSIALVLFSSASALINGVPFSNFIRLELRFVMFAITALMLTMYIEHGGSLRWLLGALVASTMIYLAWSVFNTLFIRGEELLRARYRLLPTSAVLVLALSLPYVGVMRGHRLRTLAFAAALMALLFSQTRGALLAFVVAGLVHMMVLVRRGQGARLAPLILGQLGLLAALIVFSDSNIVNGWIGRFTAGQAYGVDPTTLTRVAEFTSQFRELRADGLKMLIGAGLGQTYSWDVETLRELIAAGVVRRSTGIGSFEFGHSLWVYSLYSMGLLGGWILPTILLWSSGKSLSRTFSRRYEHPEVRRFYHGIAMALVALVLLSFSSHPLSDRQTVVTIAALCTMAFLSPAQVAAGLRLRAGRAAATAVRAGIGPVPVGAGKPLRGQA